MTKLYPIYNARKFGYDYYPLKEYIRKKQGLTRARRLRREEDKFYRKLYNIGYKKRGKKLRRKATFLFYSKGGTTYYRTW